MQPYQLRGDGDLGYCSSTVAKNINSHPLYDGPTIRCHCITHVSIEVTQTLRSVWGEIMLSIKLTPVLHAYVVRAHPHTVAHPHTHTPTHPHNPRIMDCVHRYNIVKETTRSGYRTSVLHTGRSTQAAPHGPLHEGRSTRAAPRMGGRSILY